jgi:hypothetical protein
MLHEISQTVKIPWAFDLFSRLMDQLFSVVCNNFMQLMYNLLLICTYQSQHRLAPKFNCSCIIWHACSFFFSTMGNDVKKTCSRLSIKNGNRSVFNNSNNCKAPSFAQQVYPAMRVSHETALSHAIYTAMAQN